MLAEQLAQMKPGMEIVAEDKAIGELVATLVAGDVTYLHVRRYGAGRDELYIPAIAVKRVVPRHIYVEMYPETLVGKAWHTRPTTARNRPTPFPEPLDRVPPMAGWHGLSWTRGSSHQAV